MNLFIQIIFNSILFSQIYSLISISLILSYKSIKNFNFSHGTIMVSSMYVFYFFIKKMNYNFLICILLTLTYSVLISLLLYKIIVKPFKNNKELIFITTLLFSILIEIIIVLIFGYQVKIYDKFNLNFFNFTINNKYFFSNFIELFIIFSGLIISFLIILIYKKSLFGKKLKAISESETLSKSLSLNYEKICITTLIISTIISSYIGILIGYNYVLTPNLGINYTFKAFFIIIISGLKRLDSIFFSSIIIAIFENLLIGFFNFRTTTNSIIFYSLIIITLLIKPKGILNTKKRLI